MNQEVMNCPNNHGEMVLKKIKKRKTFRDEDIGFEIDAYVCERCNLEISTIEQTQAVQLAIADAYREKVGLLTGQEIREQRKKFSWSQKELAERGGVGIASIKRWENGIIQTKSMNSALRAAFQGKKIGENYSGNRNLSIPRIKLVMKEFENELGFKFLKEREMMLFDAKYLWYADMLAYEKLGKSLTGAAYAALPHGPQLNNYKELVDLIRNADLADAEPLTIEEKKIIVRVAAVFPTKQGVFDAAHREKVWENKGVGMLIPYADASKLTEIAL